MPPSDDIVLALTGDVMTGRGVDQIMANPCDPVLHEDYVYSALEYVQLAEDAYGPIPRQVASPTENAFSRQARAAGLPPSRTTAG